MTSDPPKHLGHPGGDVRRDWSRAGAGLVLLGWPAGHREANAEVAFV